GFARFLLDLAREKGFKGLVTSLGAAALALAREYKLTALTLDIFLPDIEGWRVLERLKNDVLTRHIPVCVISTDDARQRALLSGPWAFVGKPIQTRDTVDQVLDRLKDFVSRGAKSLLLLDSVRPRRDLLREYLDFGELQVTEVASGSAALQALRERP